MGRDSWDFIIKDRLEDIEQWISEGVAEYSVCQKLGIHNATWIEQKKRHPELNELIIRARGATATLVLNSQMKAASGHSVKLLKQRVTKEGDVVDVYEEVYYPPNPQAAEFWARHIMPGYVAPRSEGAGSVTVNVQLPQVQAEIAKLAATRKQLEQELAAIDVDAEVGDPF